MTDVETVVTDFVSSGRTGRRNALPDILGSPTEGSSADLPQKLSALSLNIDEGEEKTPPSEAPPKTPERDDKSDAL